MGEPSTEVVVFAGESYVDFAKKFAFHLGCELSPVCHKRFNDAEYQARIGVSVSNKVCIIIHGLNQTPELSVNENMMTLFLMCEALRGSKAKEIIIVSPYTSMARQDKADENRSSCGASILPRFLKVVTEGIKTQYITCDLHAAQIKLAYDTAGIYLDNLFTEPYMIASIKYYITSLFSCSLEDCVIVSPDAGGAKRAQRVAEKLGIRLAIMNKTRALTGGIKDITLVGEVAGKHAIIVDDMVDTGGTHLAAATELKKNGANKIALVACHGVLSKNAIDKLNGGDLDTIIVTNSCNKGFDTSRQVIKGPHENITIYEVTPKLNVVDVSWLFAEAVRRRIGSGSVTELFQMEVTSAADLHAKTQKTTVL